MRRHDLARPVVPAAPPGRPRSSWHWHCRWWSCCCSGCSRWRSSAATSWPSSWRRGEAAPRRRRLGRSCRGCPAGCRAGHVVAAPAGRREHERRHGDGHGALHVGDRRGDDRSARRRRRPASLGDDGRGAAVGAGGTLARMQLHGRQTWWGRCPSSRSAARSTCRRCRCCATRWYGWSAITPVASWPSTSTASTSSTTAAWACCSGRPGGRAAAAVTW